MPTVIKTLGAVEIDEAVTLERLARRAVMADEEVEAAALANPDAQPLADAQLERGRFARDVRDLRARLGLTQSAFADRFAINLARLQNWEQGRTSPDSVAIAYVKVIARHPEMVEAAVTL